MIYNMHGASMKGIVNPRDVNYEDSWHKKYSNTFKLSAYVRLCQNSDFIS